MSETAAVKKRRLRQTKVQLVEKPGSLERHNAGLADPAAELARSLSESEVRYRNLTAIAPVGIFHTDAQGLVTYVNEKWCEIGGMTAEQAMGAGWLAALHPEDRKHIAAKWNAFARYPTTYRTECRYQRPDGVTAYCYVQALSVTDTDGNLTGYVGCVTDITERKRVEEALRKSEARLRSIMDHTPAEIFLLDTECRYVLVNREFERRYNITEEEVNGRTVHDFFPADIADEFSAQDREILETAKATINEQQIEYGGTLHTDLEVKFPIIDSTGAVAGIGGIGTDITERKRIEKALQEANNELELRVDARTKEFHEANHRLESKIVEHIIAADRFKALLEAGPDPSISLDRKGRIVEVNAQVERVLGYRRDELIGQNMEVLVPDQLRGRHIRHRQAYNRNPSIRQMGTGMELVIKCKDGREMPVEISLSPARIAEEAIVIASIHDITLRKESEDILREIRERHQRLIESTRAIPWEADATTWRFTYIGPQAEMLLGYPIERWFESDFWVEHIHPEDRKSTVDYCLTSSRELDDYEFDYRMIASDGRSIWFHDIVKVMRRDGKPVILSGFMIDITARKQVEDELRDLSTRLIHAQEEERSRVARELHDDFNQRIALVALGVSELIHDPAESTEAFGQRIDDLLGSIKKLSSDIHRLSHQLHPSILVHLGLAKALESLCGEFSTAHDLQIDFVDQEFPDAIPKDVALCLYRIVQEALRNVINHSGAGEASVELKRTREGLELLVGDQGVGFDVAEVKGKHGLGLISMSERLHLVGGQFAIESSEAHGTQIKVRVPLPQADGG